jgi:HEAT repeat protein
VLAAYVLGQTHGSHAVKQLQKALRDESFEVREAAVKALGDLGDPLSVDTLLEITREPQRYPLVWVIDSLGKIGHQKASPVLIATLDHQNLEVKEAAIEALGRLRSKDAAPALIALLDDANADIRHYAARSLEKLRKFIEVERKLASAKSHETMEIAAVGERENTIAVGEPLYGEDKAAWEHWWSQQDAN